MTDFLEDIVRVDLSNSSIAAWFCSFGRKISGAGSMVAAATCVGAGCGVGWDDDAT